MKNYNEKYYLDIWSKILKKYDLRDPITDLGDFFRSTILYTTLRKHVFVNTEKAEITIHDYGAGNWLYLGDLLKGIQHMGKSKIQIKAFDYSSEALEFGIKKFSHEKPDNVEIQFKGGNILDIISTVHDESVDCVISLETLEHLQEDRLAFTHYNRIVKKGGHIIISVPSKSPFFLSKNWFLYHLFRKKFTEKDIVVGHYRRYTTESLMALSKNDLSVIHKEYYGFLFSDYLKDFINLAKEYLPFFYVSLFEVVKKIAIFEHLFFNKLQISKSEGFFVIFKRNE